MALLGLAVFFLVLVAAATLAGKLPPLVLYLYLGASVVTLAAYAFDKAAAQSGRWRTRESTLHLLGLMGGWPGALVAQGVLRHKSKKQPFQILFWATVTLNCAALVWLGRH